MESPGSEPTTCLRLRLEMPSKVLRMAKPRKDEIIAELLEVDTGI